MMEALWNTLRPQLYELNNKRPVSSIGIALSGGMDSAVLLHWARHTLPSHIRLEAFHVHHGLQAQADEWAAHCQRLCAALAVPLTLHRLAPASRRSGESVEAWAREARYQWFRQQNVECFFLGHHQDDQAETVLLQLFRGAGIAGLAAMPQVWSEHNCLWARPFLQLPRSTLESYAHQHQLSWVEDPSNKDTHWQRNWIRHCVMPVIKERQPQVEACLARSASHCAETWAFLQSMTEAELARCSTYADSLALKPLRDLHPFQQKHVLRAFMQRWAGLYPSTDLLQQAVIAFLEPRDPERHRPLIHFSGIHFTLWQDAVWAHLPPPEPHSSAIPLQGPGPFSCAGGELALLSDGKPLPIPLKIVARKGGEAIQLPDRASPQPLKKLWQEAGIPPWDRAAFPLLVNEEDEKNTIAWVPLYPHFEPGSGLAQPAAYIGTGPLLSKWPDLQLCWTPYRPSQPRQKL